MVKSRNFPNSGITRKCHEVNWHSRTRGFTLLELSIALVVVGLMMKSLLIPYSGVYEQNRRQITFDKLEIVVEALVGFAAANLRLPCPATISSNGYELETCSGENSVGFVPVASLGVFGSTNSRGLLVDSWGRPIIYAVSASDHPEKGKVGQPDFTTTHEMREVGLPYLESDIEICRVAVQRGCPWKSMRANQVPFLLLSHGKNFAGGKDELENQDTDKVFVQRSYSVNEESRFDDIVTWISENRFFYEMIKAGVFP